MISNCDKFLSENFFNFFEFLVHETHNFQRCVRKTVTEWLIYIGRLLCSPEFLGSDGPRRRPLLLVFHASLCGSARPSPHDILDLPLNTFWITLYVGKGWGRVNVDVLVADWLSSLLWRSRLTLKSSDFWVCWSDDVITSTSPWTALQLAMPRMSATRNDVNRPEVGAAGICLSRPTSWVVRWSRLCRRRRWPRLLSRFADLWLSSDNLICTHHAANTFKWRIQIRK